MPHIPQYTYAWRKHNQIFGENYIVTYMVMKSSRQRPYDDQSAFDCLIFVIASFNQILYLYFFGSLCLVLLLYLLTSAILHDVHTRPEQMQ
jgi:hypothetical protein